MLLEMISPIFHIIHNKEHYHNPETGTITAHPGVSYLQEKMPATGVLPGPDPYSAGGKFFSGNGFGGAALLVLQVWRLA
jgi:hypothetical protein